MWQVRKEFKLARSLREASAAGSFAFYLGRETRKRMQPSTTPRLDHFGHRHHPFGRCCLHERLIWEITNFCRNSDQFISVHCERVGLGNLTVLLPSSIP